MQKTNNLQEIFLTQLRRERRAVTVFLMNGFQMRPVPLTQPGGED